MFLFRLVTLAVVGSAALTPLAAQGIPRGARASQQQTANASPRFMVANPFAFASADSAPAVKIGSGLREEMKSVVGRDYSVIEQAQMNDALKQYGYPIDAILSPALATTLAKNIQARSSRRSSRWPTPRPASTSARPSRTRRPMPPTRHSRRCPITASRSTASRCWRRTRKRPRKRS
jgi:hypothetical protein